MKFAVRKFALALTLGAMGSFGAYGGQDALVKFSTLGNGQYDVLGVRTLDWQETGDLGVEDLIPVPANCGGYQSFVQWAVNAVKDDECSFNVYAHGRLAGFINKSSRAITVRTLSKNGGTCPAGGGCIEVAAALHGVERARIVEPYNGSNQPKIQFLSLGGTLHYYLSPADSNVPNPGNTAPTTFSNGTPFLSATFTSVLGDFTANQGGHNYVAAGIQDYDKSVIDVQSALDGSPLATLTGTTHYAVISLPTSLQQIIQFGQGIGDTSPIYLLKDGSSSPTSISDQAFKIDANSVFAGEPAVVGPCDSCRMTGGSMQTNDQQLLIENNNPATYPSCTQGDTSCCESRNFPQNVNTAKTYAPDKSDVYDGSGQIGAATNHSQPNGEWTHNNFRGQSGQWVFRSGTKSAPKATLINHISCFDDPACLHAAANGEYKQIYWDGTGSFRNAKGEDPKTKSIVINGVTVYTDNAGDLATRHYYRAYVADLGEDGPVSPLPQACKDWKPGDLLGPLTGSKSGKATDETCDVCADVYQIEIHATTDPSSPIMYTVGGYMNKGNYQIHRETGNPN